MNNNNNNDNNKNKYSNRSFRYMVIGTVVMIIAALATAVVFGYFIKMINTMEEAPKEEIKGHYIFISEEDDVDLWNEVYSYAKEQASKDGIYLENIKDSMQMNYSNEDLLRIAVNSSVDGIVYSGSSSPEAIHLIDEAVQKGIGVVVLHNDIDLSQRQCFVGVSNYELGQMYASQIEKLVKGKDFSNTKISILVSADVAEGATNVIALAIEDSLLGIVSEEELPEIEIIRIVAEDTFSVEEEIRNLFVSGKELPDILLCLEGVYTQCVYQAVVDYNRVGEASIIGYFTSDDILEAIDRDIVYSTISIDTKEMGQAAITAIKEYNEFGYTNSYMPVSMEIIDKQKAKVLSERGSFGNELITEGK